MMSISKLIKVSCIFLSITFIRPALSQEIKHSIIFTTAFKDIGRGSYSSYARSNAEYIHWFMTLVENIEYPLVVFVEPSMIEYMQSFEFGENIVFIDMNSLETSYIKYYEAEKEIMSSELYQNKIPPRRKSNPEHLHPEYTLLMHSKCNFVSKTQELYPEHEFYGWIDFGGVRNPSQAPYNLDLSKLEKKITYLSFKEPDHNHRRSEEDMLQTDDIYVDGSRFIIHKDLVPFYERLYDLKIQEWQKNYICDDDQNLVYQLCLDHPEIFSLIGGSQWFSLFNFFR
jgi:hypothetical protein